MSVRLVKRLSSKKKKPPKNNAQAELLNKLGLEDFWTTPLDQASMVDICTSTLENQAPLETKDLPNAFLQRLWRLSPDARSPCCKALHDVLNNANKSPGELINGFGEGGQCGINPLDLVTAVFMSANTFLQQEMTVRMLQCQFAVPLVLPNIDPEEPSHFLLWPLRGAVSKWRSHFPDGSGEVLEGDLASTYMPLVSCMKLGRSVVSKSQVLNNVISGLRSPCDTFLHRGMEGGQLPRTLSNGLIEIGWCLPTGDTARDIFRVPLVISNLRGDASTHEKFFSLLCKASSAVVIFCGNLREKEKQLLASCKYMTSKLILIDLSDSDVGFVGQDFEQYMPFSGGLVLQGKNLNEEELANRLCDTMKDLLPDELKPVTLEAAAKLAEELGLIVDEQAVCKKAMATVELALEGLDEGSLQFKEKQFPLQGQLWSKLAEIEKEESKQMKDGKEIDPQLQKKKKDILVELNRYKKTPAMKIFTDSLFLSDKVERTYFLSWMKLRLRLKQIKKRNCPQVLFTYLQTQTEKTEDMSEHKDELQNRTNDNQADRDSFCTDSSFEEENNEELPINTKLQVSEKQFETGQDILQKSTEQTIEPQSQHKEHLKSTHDPVVEQQVYVTSTKKEILSEDQFSVHIFEDQNHNLEFGENGSSSLQWKQLDEPKLTQIDEPELIPPDDPELIQPDGPERIQLDDPELIQLDDPELIELDDPELIQPDGPERIQLDDPELIELDDPELIQPDGPERIQLDDPELIQLDDPELIQPDGPERIQLDDPELIQLDDPELIQPDGPERIQLDDPELIPPDDPELIQPDGPERIQLDDPELIQLDDPELIELDDPELIQPDGPERIQLDDPELIELDDPELIQPDGPERIQLDDPELIQLDDPELIQPDGPERIQLDDPELIQLDDPELIQPDGPERIQLDDPELIPPDDPELIQPDGPERIQLDDPELIQLDDPELIELDDPELIQPDGPERIQLDDPELIELDDPELIQPDGPERIQLDDPELIQLDDPELIQPDGPERIQLDDPELIQLDDPELIQPDGPERIQLDDPELIPPDEPELIQPDGPERIQLDDPELIQLDDPELIELDDPELIQPDGPERIQLDDPELIELDDPELIQPDGPERIQLDDPELIQLDDPELIRLDGPELILMQPQSDSTSSGEQQMCSDVFSEHPVASSSQPLERDLFSLGLEHFLREMGLIFELTHMSQRRGNHNVLRLPSLAADLLLYGIPLELMDGDASYIPMRWLCSVFAELKRRLPQEQCRTRVLTNLGVHHGMNAEIFSALFGVKFPEGRQKSTRGVNMVVLGLTDNLRKDLECDFLLLIDVEGLCSMSQDNKRNTLIQDNRMATVATGLSDVLMQNISSHLDTEFETNFTVIINALLRIKECGSMPICQLLTQDEDINSLLQASQLRLVSDMLQTETGDRGSNADNHYAKTTSCVTGVKGPWFNMSLSEPIDTQYSKAVLKLKQNLFGALKKCAAKSKAPGLPEFISRLCSVWDAVKSESFSIGLQNTDIALDFSLLCIELSPWEYSFMEHMERWLKGATIKIFATKAKALDTTIEDGLLSELKDEAREEVKTEVDKLRSKVEDYLMKENFRKMNAFRPILMSNMDDLQKRVTEETIQRLGTINKSHTSSTRLEKCKTLLEKEQESTLHTLVERSKSTNILFQDTELEKEFEGVWNETLCNFDFRPSETDDITARVTDILKENLIKCSLQKHMKKLESIGQIETSSFQVCDEHFGYRSRIKHMFDDNIRLKRLEAQQVACKIIEENKQFVAAKSRLPADFSDSYITQQLENVEKTLKEKSLEMRSAFEVDLKVYLCSASCQDFQKLHDRYSKDSELLACITATKSTYLAKFIYQFRKRDQCQRVAQAFTSMVIKPTVLDYIYKPLGMRIVQEIQGKAQQFQSPRAFHQGVLEELIEEDHFESFLEYLLSYEDFKLKKIQQTVVTHLSGSTNFDQWRHQRLGEIVGKVAAAVSQMAEGTSGVLSDTKPLLERVCLILESDGDVDVSRAPMYGPFFSITTKWDHFVTCLMEFLAAMRLDLSQDFSKNLEITQLLSCLSIQPKDSLFKKVRGCDRQCPLCRAPCELEGKGHEVHRALLHRPIGMLPHNSASLSCMSCPESMTEDNPGMCKDTQDMSVPCRGLHALYPDWSFTPEDSNSQMPSAYWRFVLARFSERFAKEYKQEPAEIPEEWRKITKEEALSSLKEAFLTAQCSY